MGEKLSRREFVRRAAVAAASVTFAGTFDELVAIGDLDALAEEPEASAAPAVDPDAERAPDERAQELVEIYTELSPEAQGLVTVAVRGLLAARQQATE